MASIFIAGSMLAKRFEPYIKQQAIDYLSRRFQSEVEIVSLSVNLPYIQPAKLYLTRGKGVMATVIGKGIVLRHKGRRDIPPMFAMRQFRFEIDLGRVFDPEKTVALIHLQGMEIHVPPKGERPVMPPSTG